MNRDTSVEKEDTAELFKNENISFAQPMDIEPILLHAQKPR